jgi:hypothetical protein
VGIGTHLHVGIELQGKEEIRSLEAKSAAWDAGPCRAAVEFEVAGSKPVSSQPMVFGRWVR